MGKKSKKSNKNSKAGGKVQQPQQQQKQQKPHDSPTPDNANKNSEEYDIATLQQKLKEEISEQKKNLVDKLKELAEQKENSSVDSKAREAERALLRETALLRMQLTEKEEAYDLTFEKERIESIVSEHAEAHSPHTSECPICLEDIPFVSYNTMVAFACCGGGMCWECYESNENRKLKCCPLCRGNSTPADEFRLSKIRAEKQHQPQFLVSVGKSYLYGDSGFPRNVKKGLELLNLAIEQRHPIALYQMGLLCREGNNSSWGNENFADLLPQSDAKAIQFLKEAADLGLVDAMVELANVYFGPDGDAGKDALENAIRYTTLAYHHSHHKLYKDDPKFDGMLAYNMGSVFQNTFWGNFVNLLELSKSQLLYRARHYFEEAAKKGYEKAYYALARTLLDMSIEDKVFGPGLMLTPLILFWGRKATKVTCTRYELDSLGRSRSEAASLVEKVENLVKQNCATCHKKADADVEFKRCAKCKSIWYCSKECQVKHWSDGHKSDCMKL